MASNAGKFAKIVMGLAGIKNNVSDKDAIAYVKLNKVNILRRVSDTDYVTVATAKEVRDLLDALTSTTSGPSIGDTVQVDYNKETITGPIKEISYRVKGAGNKYYHAEELKKGE